MTRMPLLVLLLAVTSSQAQQEAARSQNLEFKRIIQGIENGEADNILKAGSTRDPRFIPYLKKNLNGSYREFGGAAMSSQMALAKLGERTQLQQILCELESRDPWFQDLAARKLEYIGGWASVHAMSKLLSENPMYHKPRWLSGDQVFSPLNKLALRTLPQLVSAPPLPAPSPLEMQFETPEKDRVWRDWIQTHKDSLTKLQPTGEGLDISAAVCRRVLRQNPFVSKKKVSKTSK